MDVRKETLEELREYLGSYDGPDLHIMEVCGSHTGAIMRNGIPGLLSEHLHLLSGPGCPVCVTPAAYIDRLVELCREPDTCVVTFGDLIRVPGSRISLAQAKGQGGRVQMVYSPLDVFPLAAKEPGTRFVFAAVGFETTAPVYALMLDQIREDHVTNVQLLTALRTMPGVIDYLCRSGADIQGFLAPGHVSVVTGSAVYEPIAEKYRIPFGVGGFTGEEILTALCGIVHERGRGTVRNYYPSVVTREGNRTAQEAIHRYFEPVDVSWRGIGVVPGSGLVLRPEYAQFDAGSRGLDEDRSFNAACRCGEILTGRARPTDCPLFGRVCTPLHPQGACMVSAEGSCAVWYAGGIRRKED